MLRHVLLGLGAASCAVAAALGAAPQAGGPPALLPGDSAVSAAAGIQRVGDVARGGDRFLAVWSDLRTDFVSSGITVQQQTGFDVWAARLDAEGQLLDATPIVVHQTFGEQSAPQVAWNGTTWLVVWRSQAPTQSFYADAYLGARVAPDGTVLDDPPITLKAFQSSSSSMFSLTSNGSEWAIVCQGTSAGEGGLFGVRVAADGTVLDPGGGQELVPSTFFLYFDLTLSSAAGEYLLVYLAQSTYEARRFGADLSPIGGAFTLPGHDLASNGSSYYLLWPSGSALVGSPVTATGTVQIPAGAALSSPGSFSSPGATWDGTRWWAVWADPFAGVRLARVSAAGAVQDPGGIAYDPLLEDFMAGPVVEGAPGGGVELVWTDDRLGPYQPGDVFSAPITAGFNVGAEVPVSVGAPTQRFPDLAAGANGFLAAFRSDTSADQRILVQRLDASGAAQDAEPVEIASGPFISLPHVAWDGTRYLVVWAIDGLTYGRRVMPDGTIVDPAPLLLLDGFSPDVAALNGIFLIVGTRTTTSPQFVFPVAARFDGQDGSVLDPTPIALGQYYARSPHVTTFGGRWLATWQRNASHDNPTANVKAAFVEPDGTTAGELTVEFVGGQPDVAASDGTALFVWRTGTDSSSNPDLAARRMAPDGTFLGSAFPLAVAAGKQLHPSVAWTGTEFLVAWEDMRNAVVFFDVRTDVYGARVDEAGTVLDPSAFPLVDTETPTERPALAVGASGPVLATATFHPETPLAAYRIGVTTLAGDGPGTALCFGVGCPCGNDDATAGCANSTGVGGRLGSAGTASVAADDLVLPASQLPPGQQGLYYMGDTLVSAAFFDGLQCALGTTLRFLDDIRNSGPAGTMTLGPGIAAKAGGLIVPGSTWYFHAWHRDAAGSPCGTGANLTNLVGVTFTP